MGISLGKMVVDAISVIWGVLNNGSVELATGVEVTILCVACGEDRLQPNRLVRANIKSKKCNLFHIIKILRFGLFIVMKVICKLLICDVSVQVRE